MKGAVCRSAEGPSLLDVTETFTEHLAIIETFALDLCHNVVSVGPHVYRMVESSGPLEEEDAAASREGDFPPHGLPTYSHVCSLCECAEAAFGTFGTVGRRMVMGWLTIRGDDTSMASFVMSFEEDSICCTCDSDVSAATKTGCNSLCSCVVSKVVGWVD